MMRVVQLVASSIALSVLGATACSAPKAKPESLIVEDGSDVPETCCCKSSPLSSEDGRPVFEVANRMECSSRQGECMHDVQCQASEQPD